MFVMVVLSCELQTKVLLQLLVLRTIFIFYKQTSPTGCCFQYRTVKLISCYFRRSLVFIKLTRSQYNFSDSEKFGLCTFAIWKRYGGLPLEDKEQYGEVVCLVVTNVVTLAINLTTNILILIFEVIYLHKTII